jgi:MEDS: MEthanogen/methylotroph, DcmR Sensory domain
VRLCRREQHRLHQHARCVIQAIFLERRRTAAGGLDKLLQALEREVKEYQFREDREFIDEQLLPQILREGHGDMGMRCYMETNEHSVEFAGGMLGRHRHICAFFNSMDEEHRVLRSFIKDGFDRGEKAFHIVDPELRAEHLKRLAEVDINVERALGSGQLEVRLWQDCQFRGDRFDQDAMLTLIEEVLQSGPAAGYPLTRFLGHMEWALLDKPGLDDLSFVEFETRVNYVLTKYDDPVICTYDLSKFSASMIIDIMRTHSVVIVGGVLQENPFFVPPDQFLLEIRERRSVRRSVSKEN